MGPARTRNFERENVSRHFLYSTNPFLKYHFQEKHRKSVHYVWCSEVFDSQREGAYSLGAVVPSSSNPAELYRRLKRDVESEDRHSSLLTEKRASLVSVASNWRTAGHISPSDLEDILFQIANSPTGNWRPLLYVIPREIVASRLLPVQAIARAGLGDEFIIPDLMRAEFDVLEW